MTDRLLTVVVRSSDPSRLPFLDQALFSLCTQGWDSIEVLIMLQNPAAAFVKSVRSLAEKFAWPKASTWRVVPVKAPAGMDARARLLNVGIAEGRGRYLAFLDDDDVVYPGGYAWLIGALQRDGDAALAAGGCRMAYCQEKDGRIFMQRKERGPFDWGRSRLDLITENFLPIHSFVLDFDKVRAAKILFRDAAVPVEDYDFLLHLAEKHSFVLGTRNKHVCEYRIHARNSLWSAEQAFAKVVPPKLQAARDTVNRVKIGLQIRLTDAEGGGSYPSPPPVLVDVSTPEPVMAEPVMAVFTFQPRFLHRLADRFYARLSRFPRIHGGVLGTYLFLRRRPRRR